MLGQLKTAVVKQLGSVDHGVHEKIFSFFHVAHLLPAKNLFCGETVSVLHDFFLVAPCFS